MQIHIKSTKLEITPALQEYARKRLEPLARFVKRYEANGDMRLFLELARTTRHHRKGNVFYAEATMELPKGMLRGEVNTSDIRTSIDELRDVLKREIESYKEKHSF